ncbi:MAG: alcohol dehydrogenase [Syntrophaceticus sp.]|nr:alcohol dehydrogenase [Syntrophaceticus sp.]MDD4782789.1 alcohol dehydrogenase [Syntrophaceticus sp.]
MDQKTMKALVYHGPSQISLDDIPVPQIKQPTDAILKVTTSTICGSDIHIIHGYIPSVQPGTVVGHEFCGEIVELGSSIGGDFKVGDRVAVSCIVHCGKCFYCLNDQPQYCEVGRGTEGWSNSMLFGNYINGCQAEYIRVPLAETGMYKIPEGLDDLDVLFVGDILSTGYFGAEKCNIQHGDTVVVWGSGPVGMCAMASARLWSPAQIIAVDLDQNRLETAKKNGVCDIIINSGKEDAAAKVMELTNGRGADCAIEAIGLVPTIDSAMKTMRVGGRLEVIGFGTPTYELSMADLFMKNLSVGSGLVPANHMGSLIELIHKGKLNLRFLATHTKPLNDIVEGYDIFGNKKDNCIKWVVTPYEE